MKLLEKGNYEPRAWKMEVECTGQGFKNNQHACHSILEVNVSDIVVRKSDLVGVGATTMYGFVCPECHCFTRVSDKYVPDELRKKQEVVMQQRESDR